MKTHFYILILLCFTLPACQPSQGDLDATATQVAYHTASTQTAQAPTQTPIPSDTPSPTATPKPTNTPTAMPSPTPNPVKLLDAALENLHSADTYALTNTVTMTLATEGMSFDIIMDYEGDFQAPNRSQGRMFLEAFGEQITQDMVVIGDAAYVRNSEAQVWMVDNESTEAVSEETITGVKASDFETLTFAGLQTIENQLLIHLQGKITDIERAMDPVSARMWREMGINPDKDSYLEIEYWINPDDNTLLHSSASGELTATIPIDNQQKQEMTILLISNSSFSNIDDPIRISKPETPTGMIMYVVGDGTNETLYSINADGSGKMPLILSNWSKKGAAWSPDGSQIAYSENNVNNDLYLQTFGNTKSKQITDLSSDETFPDWSPDGTKFAFDSNQTGNWDIYVMDADGSNMRNLTNHPATHDIFPAWSPDGTKIAFGSNRDGVEHIYIMNADGSDLTQLTNNPVRNDGYPTWSPDGTKIAFAGVRFLADNTFDLYIIDVDGSNETRITHSFSDDVYPDWSPDGTRIAFSSNPEGDYDIWIINVNGTGLVQLTYDWTNEMFPEWRPCVDTCETNEPN